jgi:hypothetical protein
MTPQDVSLRTAWNRLHADSAGAVILRTGVASIFSGCEYFLLKCPLQIKIIIAATAQVIMMIQNINSKTI